MTCTRSKTCSIAPAGTAAVGACAARSLSTSPDPSFTRSRFEKTFRRLVIAARFPAPSMNFNFAGYELDAYWPDLRFVVELDLFETHGTRAAFERDHVRQEELKLLGDRDDPRHPAPAFNAEPEAVMGTLATLLQRRRRELRRSLISGLVPWH